MNLLIVDDTPANLKLLRIQLESEGHTVFEAYDGVNALALLERQRVDVVISDILMPCMDGYRLSYEIRKHARLHDLPIILCTSSYTSPDDEKLALHVGADKYLKRPVSLETIVAALHEAIAMPHAAPRPRALQEVEVLMEYSARLVSKLEEKNTELQAQTEALRLPSAALTAAANAILIANRDGTIVWVNPAFTTLTGYTFVEAVGKNSRDLIKSGQQERAVYEEMWATILAGRVWHGQLVNRHKDGSLYPEEQTITPVRDAHGEITHFVAIKQDLSDRKHAEEALRQSEERYRLLFERAPDAIFALAPTGAITSLNHAFETITGWPPAQWLGRPFQDLIHPDDQTRAGELFQLVLGGERVPTFELRMRTVAGGFRDVEFTGFSSELSGGRIEVQGIGRDITERKQTQEEILCLNAELEERVRQRTAQLQAVNQELEAFSYSVSHDLRAPLSAIDGFSDLLDKEIGASAVSERGKHYLARIRAGVVQMGELIDALLSLAQVSRTSLHWSRVDLSAMAQTVLNGYQEREPGRAAQWDIQPGLIVQGDSRLLLQVLDNLLGNAWKFSGKQPQTRIAVGRENDPDGEAVYAVRDNGAGFDMAFSEKLFCAFQRLHTVSEFSGTGIGLATVHRIVTRHGGRVWAESVTGQDTAFYFTLGRPPT